MTIRVVSLDGGGIKGALTARILSRLEAASPGWLARVDLFAGTSTGGILALALASELSPEACVSLYRDRGPSIFAPRDFMDAIPGDEYVRADYGSEGLRAALVGIFGSRCLGDLNHDVLIPAFDLKRWQPKFFDREHDANARIVDVALATSAAPTYFPIHAGKADGGLFANNPSDSALAFLLAKGAKLSDVRMLSVGTGASPVPAPGSDGDWGFRQWIVKDPHYLLSVLFDGSVLASHYRSKVQLSDRYVRVQPMLPERVEMDDPEKVSLLLDVADRVDLAEAMRLMASE